VPERGGGGGRQQGWRRGLWRRGVVRPRRMTRGTGSRVQSTRGLFRGAAWSWWAGPYRVSIDGRIAQVSVNLIICFRGVNIGHSVDTCRQRIGDVLVSDPVSDTSVNT